MSLILGIDPGLTGAVGAISHDGCYVGVSDFPIIRDGKTAWVDPLPLLSIIRNMREAESALPLRCAVVIERVHSMPRQGVASCFGFGVTFGSLLAIARMLDVPLHFVTPSTWKGDLGLSKDKRASLDKARLLFPDAELHLAKHEGRAEALLLAHWYHSKGKEK